MIKKSLWDASEEDAFEILTADGSRWRWAADEYFWQYPSADSPDSLDTSRVEVLREVDGQIVFITTFHNVVAVGRVNALTTMSRPKEQLQYECPRCGWSPIGVKKDD